MPLAQLSPATIPSSVPLKALASHLNPSPFLAAPPRRSTMDPKPSLLLLFLLALFPHLLQAASVYPFRRTAGRTAPQDALLPAGGSSDSPQPDRYLPASELVKLRYHMGPVLSAAPLNVYVLWYGNWSAPALRQPLRDFLMSLSNASAPAPSVAQWWSTVGLYGDQTNANVSRTVALAGEADDAGASLGMSLSRLDMQRVIASALSDGRLPVDNRGAYIVFTAAEVSVQDFCRAVCGFHYFTFPSVTGHTLPYAWVGNSGKQCPDVCAYPFVLPSYMSHASGISALRPPNDDAGVDGMVSVLAHELAEMTTNPLVNAWYAGEDPTAPTEIADLCEGVYGTGGGGGYAGQVSTDGEGRSFNAVGGGGRQFLIQWVWSPALGSCTGPNAVN